MKIRLQTFSKKMFKNKLLHIVLNILMVIIAIECLKSGIMLITECLFSWVSCPSSIEFRVVLWHNSFVLITGSLSCFYVFYKLVKKILNKNNSCTYKKSKGSLQMQSIGESLVMVKKKLLHIIFFRKHSINYR